VGLVEPSCRKPMRGSIRAPRTRGGTRSSFTNPSGSPERQLFRHPSTHLLSGRTRDNRDGRAVVSSIRPATRLSNCRYKRVSTGTCPCRRARTCSTSPARTGTRYRPWRPQRAYRHTYQAPGCEFRPDVQPADRLPVAMQSAGERINTGMRDFRPGRGGPPGPGTTSRPGVMNGSLVLEGESVEVVDAAVIKDRTWGAAPDPDPASASLAASYMFAPRRQRTTPSRRSR